MNREEQERMVDRLLNQALGPHEIEPRPGLENRILANLRAQPERRPWWRWLWVPAVIAAVVLLTVLVRVNMWRESPTHVTRSQARATRPELAPATPPLSAQHPAMAAHKKRNHPVARPRLAHGLPRQDVFPSPVPVTSEEQMLLALSRRNPAQAVLVAREREMEWERVLKGFDEVAAPASTAQQDSR